MAAIFLVSCTGLQKGKKLQKLGYLSCGEQDICLNQETSDSVTFQYTSCNGFLIRKGDVAVLSGPFYSNVGPMLSASGKSTASDTLAIDHYFKEAFGADKDTTGVIKTVIVSHSHYDHLMDVPYLFHNKLHKPSVKILVNTTGWNYLVGAGIPERNLVKLDTINCASTKNRSVLYDNKVKIYPIISAHAPHARIFGAKIFLFRGNAKEAKWPEKRKHMLDGQFFAYIVDFLKDGKEDFRIYVPGSPTEYPLGFPNELILKKKTVDVAVLAAAVPNAAGDYPMQIINHLKPKHVIWSHWENFFHPMKRLEKEPRTLPIGNTPKFLTTTDVKLQKMAIPTSWSLPNTNAKLNFYY